MYDRYHGFPLGRARGRWIPIQSPAGAPDTASRAGAAGSATSTASSPRVRVHNRRHWAQPESTGVPARTEAAAAATVPAAPSATPPAHEHPTPAPARPESAGAPGHGPASAAHTGDADSADALRAEVARLSALVEEKDLRARESAARAQHSAEELERAKARIRKDAAEQIERRNRSVLLSFLDVLDDLDRSLEAARSNDHAPAIAEGVALVRKRFRDTMGQHGVRPCPAIGERFDPSRHEAVSAVPVQDPAQDGMVVGVVREGYLIGDTLLRPASVAVGKAS